MKITDISGLFVGKNADENFNILIAATDEQDAQRIADEYASESGLGGTFAVTELPTEPNDIMKLNFDCDYVVL